MPGSNNVVDFRDRLPTSEEVDNAVAALETIANDTNNDGSLQFGGAVLSPSLVGLLNDLFGIIARGETVTLAPLSRRLTTQEAADILNVSRTHLIKLLERDELQHERVGTHRRIPLSEVLAYKADRSARRRDALAEMQELAEDLDA